MKVEVKSGSYLQSWKQKELSKISFDIRPTSSLDADSNKYDGVKIRQSDVYVFCVLAHQNMDTVNPIDLDQWQFLVLCTAVLDLKKTNQKTISLNALRKLNPIECKFGDISVAVQGAVTHD